MHFTMKFMALRSNIRGRSTEKNRKILRDAEINFLLKTYFFQRSEQDAGVGRHGAHLPPQTHQKYIFM